MAQKIRIKHPDQTILIVLTFLWAIHKFTDVTNLFLIVLIMVFLIKSKKNYMVFYVLKFKNYIVYQQRN